MIKGVFGTAKWLKVKLLNNIERAPPVVKWNMEVKGQAGSMAVKAAAHTSEDPVSTKGRPYPENSLIWRCADWRGEGKTVFKMPG